MTVNLAWMNSRPSGGMIPRKRETFKGPLRFARIGHSTKGGSACTHEQNLASPWWLSGGTMEHLWKLARDSGTPLSTLVRQRCCIPYYWNSSCDLVYEADLSGYVEAWIGPGTFFYPERGNSGPPSQGPAPLWPEDDVVFFPAGEFPQIYIPGLWETSVREKVWRSVTVVAAKDLQSATSYVGARRLQVL